MFICVRPPVCAHDALFLYRVWCGTDSEQQGWRESLLTGSDGKLWNGNKASCHYNTNSFAHTHRYTGERSKTAMITDKRANNISQLSLAGRLNSNCYERHVWWTENRFECLQILLPLKLKALWSNREKLLFEFFFFCFVFEKMNPTNQLPSVQYTACCLRS